MIIGIMFDIIKKESDVPVDPEGKFCYGRGILKLMVITHPGIPPWQSAGAAFLLDLFSSLRR